MCRALPVVLLAFLLVACGATSVGRVPHAPVGTSLPSGSPSTTEFPHQPMPPRASPDVCAGQQVRVRPSIIEPALGHRYLLLTVRNCGAESLTLPALPELRMVSRKGEESALTVEPWAPGQESLTLAPGDTAYLGLEWLAVGRSVARADRLEVTFVGTGTTLIDNFDLARSSVVTAHAWVRTPDQAWPR